MSLLTLRDGTLLEASSVHFSLTATSQMSACCCVEVFFDTTMTRSMFLAQYAKSHAWKEPVQIHVVLGELSKGMRQLPHFYGANGEPRLFLNKVLPTRKAAGGIVKQSSSADIIADTELMMLKEQLKQEAQASSGKCCWVFEGVVPQLQYLIPRTKGDEGAHPFYLVFQLRYFSQLMSKNGGASGQSSLCFMAQVSEVLAPRISMISLHIGHIFSVGNFTAEVLINGQPVTTSPFVSKESILQTSHDVRNEGSQAPTASSVAVPTLVILFHSNADRSVKKSPWHGVSVLLGQQSTVVRVVIIAVIISLLRWLVPILI